MNFYNTRISFGNKRRFACGVLIDTYNYETSTCPMCYNERREPDLNNLFSNKNWNPNIYMNNDYYADFLASSIIGNGIVSEKAMIVLKENFGNTIDFGNIEMISYRDLDEAFLRKVRDYSGNKAAKQIANDPPQYYRLILNVGASLNLQLTNMELSLDCLKCGRKEYGAVAGSREDWWNNTPHIIESSWKGYDLFHVEGKGNTVFCTERFIEVYKHHALTGLEFEQVLTV